MTAQPDLTPAKGSYILLLRLDEPVSIRVGRLGDFDFPAGYYTYSGSALGPGGIWARIARHIRKNKARHWHIDYLSQTAKIIAVVAEPSSVRRECEWNARLSQEKGAVVAPGFGSSDCSCITHLFFFPNAPDLRGFGQPLSLASWQSSGTS